MRYDLARNADPLFNVRVNGEDIETLVSRSEAEQYLGQGLGFVQIYLSTKALEGRKPAWQKSALPRPWRFSVSAKEREASMARVLKDPEIDYHYDAQTASIDEVHP